MFLEEFTGILNYAIFTVLFQTHCPLSFPMNQEMSKNVYDNNGLVFSMIS